jgi:hypothetical protein
VTWELSDKLWKRPVISRDNKWIAGFYSDRQLGTQKFPDSIAIVSVDGGLIRKVIPIPSSFELSAGPRWSPVSGIRLFSFDWSADGKELAFSRGIETKDVVLVEDARR